MFVFGSNGDNEATLWLTNLFPEVPGLAVKTL